MAFTLPNLPYAHDALDPIMGRETLELHHGKHHNTYVTNLNKFTEGTDLAEKSLDEVVKLAYSDPQKQGIFNNAGQHWNHCIFWAQMSPKGGGDKLPGKLAQKINDDFGSLDKFKEDFVNTSTTVFGSGWGWLVLDNDRLRVVKTPNGENPLVHGQHALIGIDMWEHAYYLDYRNRKAEYVRNFLDKLVNWEYAEERLNQA